MNRAPTIVDHRLLNLLSFPTPHSLSPSLTPGTRRLIADSSPALDPNSRPFATWRKYSDVSYAAVQRATRVAKMTLYAGLTDRTHYGIRLDQVGVLTGTVFFTLASAMARLVVQPRRGCSCFRSHAQRDEPIKECRP